MNFGLGVEKAAASFLEARCSNPGDNLETSQVLNLVAVLTTHRCDFMHKKVFHPRVIPTVTTQCSPSEDRFVHLHTANSLICHQEKEHTIRGMSIPGLNVA